MARVGEAGVEREAGRSMGDCCWPEEQTLKEGSRVDQ